MLEWEVRFIATAAQNDGLVGKYHLPELGLDWDAWWRARRSGRWLPEGDRVLRSASAPRTDGQRIRASVLDAAPGAFVHGTSSLAWLGMRGFSLAELQVARLRGISGVKPRLARLHELRTVRSHDLIVVRGILTETALRAIWAEAARYAAPRQFEVGAARIGALLDQAHRLNLVTWAGLHETVEDLGRRGRAGTTLLRHLAAERLPGTSPTESRLEDRFEEVLRGGGQRLFRRQIRLGGHELIGRCDFSDELLPLASEINSLLFHTAPTDRASDERRYRALVEAGFTVVVIWEDDLWRSPRAVIETVEAARRCARAGRRVVVHSPSCPWPHPRFGDPDAA